MSDEPAGPPPAGERNLLRTAIGRPVTVLVGVVLVMMFGLLSVTGLPIQLTPDITIPTLTITTRWPGAAPIELEAEILEEQEDAIKGVPGLVKMKAEAKPDEAVVTLEFEVGTSIEEALVRVNNALTQVPNYPEGAREPVINTATNAGPPLAVITIQSPTGEPVAQYRTWVEQQILPQIERIQGVASIRHIGGQESQVQVDFDVAALASRGLTVAEVASRIQGELRNVSGGDMTLGKRRYLVRTPVAPPVPEKLTEIVVGAGDDGTPIHLGDVATVRTGLRKPSGAAMSDDRPSMVLLLWREAGSNVLEVAQDVRGLVGELQTSTFAPEGLQIELIFDQTGYINGALDLVRQNLLLGAVLAIGVLLVFLRSFTASAVIAIAIPVCVFGTALGMALLGRTINVVSLAGTAFAVGMVVDNSIVVLESIDTWRRRVPSGFEAAYRGVREVWGAVLASTVTTAAVFIPIIGWQDEVGELLRDVAVAIAWAVSVSLLVSVLVIPSFSAKLLRPRPKGERPGAIGRVGERLRDGVARQVRWLVQRLWRGTAVAAIAIAVTAGVGVQLLPSLEYLPTGNRNLIFGILVPPPGTSPDELQKVGDEVQGEITRHWRTEVDGVPSIERSFFVAQPNQVIAGAVATNPDEIRDLLTYLRGTWSKLPDTFAFATQASLFATSIGGGRAVEVEISGADLGEIVGLGGMMMGTIRQEIPKAQIRPIPSLELGAPEIHAVPRRDEAAGLRVGGAELGLMVDALVDGAFVGELGPEGEPKIDVVLRAGGTRPIEDPEDLAAAPVATASGRVVPLGSLADVTETLGPTFIQRIERRRAITLQVSPPEDLPLEQALATIRDRVVAPLRDGGKIGEGLAVDLRGTAGKLEAAKERFAGVIALAVVITFLLLAALYEDFLAPLAVLVTLPLAAGGGVLGLWVVDRFLGPQPLDLMTALGFIILVGVVVNNAILVVDGALARLRKDAPLADAVAGAVKSRVRPIFMSTMTSLAGLLPMVVFPGSGAELYRGVGAIVLGGLALSTVLTLYVVPSVFALLWRARGVR